MTTLKYFILFAVLVMATGNASQLGMPAIAIAFAVIAVPAFILLINSHLDGL